MKSLRAKLLLGTTLGLILVLLVSGVALDVLVGGILRREFDRALAEKGRALSSLVDQDEDGLEFELADASLPEYAAPQRAEYFEIWNEDSSPFTRSHSLKEQDLERVADPTARPVFRSIRLPDGRPGRIAVFTFTPRCEETRGVAPQPVTLTIAVARDVLDLNNTLSRIRGWLIGVGLIAIALSATVQIWIVRLLLRPLARLRRQIDDMGEHDLSTRIDSADLPSELTPVVACLNDLLTRLGIAFHRERRFTGDVAHELRTPLAGLRARLELALSRERTPDVYRNALCACLEIGLQMQQLVENLLQLARFDAGQVEMSLEPVNVAKLVHECWSPLEHRAQQRELQMEWRIENHVALETDPDKLRLVVRNLLDNAVVHADEGGRIVVQVSSNQGSLVIVFGNSCSRIAHHDVSRVFERFWRFDSVSLGQDARHYGLGLPLCKTIMELLGGSIEAALEKDNWFTVTIRLSLHKEAK